MVLKTLRQRRWSGWPCLLAAALHLLALLCPASPRLHDPNGTCREHEYDAAGRMIQFVHDAEGNRTHQTNGSQTTRYTVNPHGLSAMSEVIIEHKPDNTKRWYVWGGPAGLLYESQTDSGGTETNVRYYHSDQVGSTLALTDGAAEVTGRVEYSPYGMITHSSGVLDTPYLYNGAFGVQTDAETGLLHMRARYYHPWLGRFISQDPIQFNGGNNWYAFTSGDPIFGSDPSGLTERVNSGLGNRDWAQFSNWNSSSLSGWAEVAEVPTNTFVQLSAINASVTAERWQHDNMVIDAVVMAILIADGAPGDEMAYASARAGTSRLAANNAGKLYHYTGEANVAGILEKGLVPGRSGQVFTTPNGTLTPLQAQIELALPANRGLPGAMLEIDAAALQRAGIQPSLGPLRVQPTPNAPGGGVETIFNQAIPPEFIRRVP